MTVVSYVLTQPVLDAKTQFKKNFPKAPFLGDIGNPAHLKGSGDHTPWASDKINGMKHRPGYVYAADLGNGTGFDTKKFSAWLLAQVKAGKYPELKYFISNYELYDRRYGWKKQKGTDGPGHVHMSFMPGHEKTKSTIVSDYFHHLQGKAPPGQPPAVPITARTTWDGKVIGNKAPNARLVTADKAPRLGLGAKDEAMGGWVTFAEHKLGVAANGYFGPEMVEAVKRLQRSRRLPVTGKIDAKTWRSLGQPL